MTRLLLRLMGLMILVCIGALLLALALGRMLMLPNNEILFTAAIHTPALHIYRMDLAHGLSARIENDIYSDTQPIWSPDGQQIAYNTVFQNGTQQRITIFLQDIESHLVHQLIDNPGGEYYPTWSPDGRSIAYTSTRYGTSEIMLTDIQSGLSQRLTDNSYTDSNPTWSPDGRSIAYISYPRAGGDSVINILNLQTGTTQTIVGSGGSEVFPSWSSDGQYVLYVVSQPRSAMYLWDVAQAQSHLFFLNFSRVTGAPDWSQDGRYILYDDYIGDVHNGLFRLEVATCLQNPTTCSAQPLPLPDAFYTAPHWRPHQP